MIEVKVTGTPKDIEKAVIDFVKAVQKKKGARSA